MGVVFVEHMGGSYIYSCSSCNSPLTSREHIVSTRFTGTTGRAFLFNRVLNIKLGHMQQRAMMTGVHYVKDVACKRCNAKLGWAYELATEEEQRYKEGKVVLERALITESPGIENDSLVSVTPDYSSDSS